MKILVTGYSGQLGFDVVKEGKKRGLEMIGVGQAELDITDEDNVTAYVHSIQPDAIIHCAAYTAVDHAEDNKEACWDVNVNGTKYLASAAKAVQAKFTYISTDYVFEGTGTTPFTEADPAKPVSYYGRTKYEGEKIVQELIEKFFIVRISWVFGINGNNFIKTMLRLAETRDELNVVGDQYGSPTYTFDLAKLLLDMVATEKYGVYHAANEGFTNWAEFAKEIFQVAGKRVKVNSIKTEKYPTKAVRPKNSRMSKNKLVENGFRRLPSWQDAITRYIAELQEEVNKMTKKKVLVTGGAGFIGGNFVQYMVNKYPNYDIYNLDLLTYAGDLTKHQSIEDKENYHFVKADIADREAIFALFEKEQFDYVTHFAAESHVDRSITDPEIFVKTNVLGTQVLLDASKKIGVKKFVHVSTDEVYGELDFDPTTFFTEDTPLQPNSPYSASKASSDLLVRAYHETFGLPVNITRCSNNYGPFHFPEKLIPLTISRVLNEQKIPVYGDGKNIRDWLHVIDHCAAIDLVLHEGVKGEVYNVGGHNERTNLEVVKTIISTLGKSEDLIEFVTDRLGHDKRYAIDPTKLEKLGWKPTYTFETGIAQTIQWYLDNKEWWEHIISGEYQQYFEKQYSV